MNNNLFYKIRKKFKDRFKTEPIIIQSPGRVNLIGEHTDYNMGYVFPAAIDRNIITAIGKNASTSLCNVIALDKEESYSFSLNKIKPVSNGEWRNYALGVFSEIQKKGITLEPLNIVFGGDIPSGAGLSSSAALENSLVFGINEICQLGLTKEEMILISQKAEHNFVGVQCGIMDQYASMFGKESHALLLDCKTQKSIPICIDFEGYQFVLINTHVKHNLAESAYNSRRAVCEKVASVLGVSSLRDSSQEDLKMARSLISDEAYKKASYVIRENRRVLSAAEMIKSNDLMALGRLLFESHYGLQHYYKVSCPELDFLVNAAMKDPDIIGARMMGGGFGGCTLNLVKSGSNKKLDVIGSSYQMAFGIQPSIYYLNLSDGVKRVS